MLLKVFRRKVRKRRRQGGIARSAQGLDNFVFIGIKILIRLLNCKCFVCTCSQFVALRSRNLFAYNQKETVQYFRFEFDNYYK